MTTRHTLVPSVYLLLRKDNKVLLIRRANTGYRDGYYSFPAGHVEGNESILLAGIREAQEEVGVDILEADMKFVHVMHRVAEEKDHERVDFFFEVEKWKNEPRNNEPDKCDEVRWFNLDDLPDMLAPVPRMAIQNILAGKSYSDKGF